eukprot:s219_g52.t1
MATPICGGAKISFERVAEGQVALNLRVEVPAVDLKDLLLALTEVDGHEDSPKGYRDVSASPKSDRFPTFDPFEQIEDEIIEGFEHPGTELALQEMEVPEEETVALHDPKPCEVSASSVKVLRRHSSWVNGVAWAADQENKENEKIVTGSSNHTACIWKPSGNTQWKAIKTLRAGSTDGFRALAWSPDCSRLVAAGMDHEALVYNVSGPEHRQWEASGILRGHSDILRAVSWSPCGRKVLTGGDDKTARIWKASRMDPLCWEQVAILNGHCDSVRAVAWRPDPDKVRTQNRVVIATGLADSTIVLWQSHVAPHDRRSFEVFATLSGHSGAIRSLDWAWDGTQLASGSTDATTRIWHCDGWQEVAKLEVGTCAGVKAVAWSPDGRKLATGGADAILRVWTRGDLHQWNLAAELTGHQAAIRALCWSPDGGKVLTGSADRTARIWRVDGR